MNKSSANAPERKAMSMIRMDEWASVADAPIAVPFKLMPKGGVFRGMRDLEEAKAYADGVRDFFAAHGARQSVFVVRGPTSTTRMPFEVVDATCGCTRVYTAPAPAEAPRERAAHMRELCNRADELAPQHYAWLCEQDLSDGEFEQALHEIVDPERPRERA
jgi:hypothetical protein